MDYRLAFPLVPDLDDFENPMFNLVLRYRFAFGNSTCYLYEQDKVVKLYHNKSDFLPSSSTMLMSGWFYVSFSDFNVAKKYFVNFVKECIL